MSLLITSALASHYLVFTNYLFMYKTIFGKEFRFELSEKIYYRFGIRYTNQDYNNYHELWIWFFWQIYIHWDENYEDDRIEYWLEIDWNRILLSYGKNDYFQEKPWKRWWFWWDRIPDFFLWKEKRLWADEDWHGKFPLKMGYGDEYICTVTSKQLYGWRPRWFWKKYWRSYEVTPDRSIPYEGKWENSWDCGIDGTSQMNIWSVWSPDEAVEELKKSCEKYRIKYWMVSDEYMKDKMTPMKIPLR